MDLLFFFAGGSNFKILVEGVQNLNSQVSDKFTNQVLVMSF